MRSTERSGTATTKVAVPSSRLPATARQRMSPFVDPTVKGVPWRTRGSFSGSGGTAACRSSPVGGTQRASEPSVGSSAKP